MKSSYDKYDAILRVVPSHIKAEVDLEFAISTRIYDLMTQKGLSKAEFARAIGKRPCEITKWLSGQHNFTLSTLAMLSLFFGQPIITVGGMEDEPVGGNEGILEVYIKKIQGGCGAIMRFVEQILSNVEQILKHYSPDTIRKIL